MPDGGLRDRLIHESILQNIVTHLTSLGWFDVGRQHQPITVIDEYPDETGEVAYNTLAITMGDAGGITTELGNTAEDHEIIMFVDFFAESDSLGRHVIGDIYKYLRTNNIQQVRDYEAPLTPVIFTVEVDDDVEKRRPSTVAYRWQKHWQICSFTVIDYGRTNV